MSSSIRSVVYYGHGAPGMMTIGDDYTLTSDDVVSQLTGKMAPNGEVHLVGCNTASIGSRAYESSPAEMVFYGLSVLARRLAYFSAPVMLGGLDKDTANAHWDDDMANETSRGLPNVRITGFRTFAFPADRLVPGSSNVTPSPYVMARSVTYRDSQEVR